MEIMGTLLIDNLTGKGMVGQVLKDRNSRVSGLHYSLIARDTI